MKKIIVIIILVVSIGLIGTGIFFGLAGDEVKMGDSPNNEEIVNLDEEIAQNEEVHSENVHKYKTVEDAKAYLAGIYETDQVTISYNDGRIARIKLFADTEDEVNYIYQINGGDLVIEY